MKTIKTGLVLAGFRATFSMDDVAKIGSCPAQIKHIFILIPQPRIRVGIEMAEQRL